MPGSSLFVVHAVADPTLPDAITAVAGGGIRVTPLVYDAYSFLTAKQKTSAMSAVATEYMDRLRSVGAPGIIMPGYGSITG
jgi:hypothetical protein